MAPRAGFRCRWLSIPTTDRVRADIVEILPHDTPVVVSLVGTLHCGHDRRTEPAASTVSGGRGQRMDRDGSLRVDHDARTLPTTVTF